MDRVRRGGEAEVVSSSLTERAIFDMWHVYFLRNGDGRLYVGMTGRDPAQRLLEHNIGLNSWTRARGPWTLLHVETYDQKASALRREKFFKTGAGREERDRIVAALNG